MKKNYVVGYGTLLYEESVGDTIGEKAKHKAYIPVLVKGFKRLFNLLPEHYKPSFKISEKPVEKAAANVIRSAGHYFNGLAFEVSDDELKNLNKRESHYDLILTDIFDFFSHVPLGKGIVYSASEELDVVTRNTEYLPDWEDISWARTGAYRYGESFGKVYDETTFLVDGKTRVVDYYKNHLEELNLDR